MATTTATILVGHPHSNDGGIYPTHVILLTENSRPALVLRSLDGNDDPCLMIPTLENMVDDIYLLITTHVLGIMKPDRHIANPTGESMYELYTDDERQVLYAENLKAIEQTRLKVVFHLLHDSHLLHQLELINRYPADVEITTPYFTKEYSNRTDKVKVTTFK